MTFLAPAPLRKAPDHLEKRYRATVGIALRFTRELWWASKTGFLRSPEQQQAHLRALYTRQAVQFREFATRMGGLIIKLGQFLSVRIDSLPKEYIEELGKLQDAVPPVDTATMIRVVERELGRPISELFASFDPEPLAAASLGQVHRATLASGEDVAVKILRPGIEELIETDIRSLRSILRLLDRLTSVGKYMDVRAFGADFENTFRDELDYAKEGANAETFQRNFLLNMHVEMPKIYWSQSSTRVLTMEFMNGVKINELDAIDEMGVDRAEVAKNLLEIYLQMFLADGFYHADPHPGNVLVRPDGIIQLIDFGQVGSLPDDMRRQFTDLIVAVFSKDASGMIQTLRELGFLGADADTQLLKQILVPMIDTMIGEVGSLFTGESFLDQMMSGRSLESFHIDAQALDDMRELILTQPIRLPGSITFLGKALITIFTNCYRLDPSVDLVAVTEPYIRSFATPHSIQDVLSMVMTDGTEFFRNLPRTAKRVVALADRLYEGELEVGLSRAQLQRMERLSRANTRKVGATVVASTAALGAWLAWLLRRRS
jgi:predicted unusual protein kinase regulating ubiquinone biosynthesis (AarF/ABC1/UbiB family)